MNSAIQDCCTHSCVAARSPNGRFVASGGSKKTRGKILGQLCFSPDGSMVMAEVGGSKLKVWDSADYNGALQGTIKTTAGAVAPMAEGVVLHGGAKVWRLGLLSGAASRPLQLAKRCWSGPNCVASTPDGSVIAAHHEGTPIVIRGKDMTPLSPLGRHVHAIAVSADGRWLAAAGGSGLRLWALADDELDEAL